MKKFIGYYLLILLSLGWIKPVAGQSFTILSGPIQGYTTYREVRIQLEATAPVSILFRDSITQKENPARLLPSAFPSSPAQTFVFENLTPGHTYFYRIVSSSGKGGKSTENKFYSFKTPEIWEWRGPAPNFTFLMGSCVFINEAAYDRPGEPYGKSTNILYTMAKEKAEFMLWLGDNSYYREADFSSPSGMLARFQHARRDSAVQTLLKSHPNLAIWDDHDFGPNNSDRSFVLKETALDLFKAYWPNPDFSNGERKGIYTSFSHGDLDFFMMDNRYFRASNYLKDTSINKPYWGTTQLEWLKENLLNSKAAFKMIANGNQILNQLTDSECLNAYPHEYNDLLNFICDNKIKNVIFLTGDRHFTELLKLEKGGCVMYDFTSSPLTSGPYAKVSTTKEGTNPLRVEGTLYADQNYGRVSIAGEKGKRILSLETLSSTGERIWRKDIPQQ